MPLNFCHSALWAFKIFINYHMLKLAAGFDSCKQIAVAAEPVHCKDQLLAATASLQSQ